MTDTDGTPQIPDRPLLSVWPGVQRRELIEAFAAALGPGAEVLDHDADTLNEGLTAGRTCAVVWQRPETPLAGALAAGSPVAPVLTQWLDRAQRLLDLYRRNRRRLVLLAEDSLTGADPLTRTQLRDRLGLSGDFSFPAPGADTSDPAALLAALAVPQLGDLRPVLAELEASSVFRAPRGIDAAGLDEAGAGLARDRERLALLSEQTDLMRQELEALASRAEAERSRLEAGAEQLRSAARDTERTVARARAEARTAAEARSRAEAELAAMHKTLIARENELAALRSSLDGIYASNSWKITAPLRGVRRKFSRPGA